MGGRVNALSVEERGGGGEGGGGRRSGDEGGIQSVSTPIARPESAASVRAAPIYVTTRQSRRQADPSLPTAPFFVSASFLVVPRLALVAEVSAVAALIPKPAVALLLTCVHATLRSGTGSDSSCCSHLTAPL